MTDLKTLKQLIKLMVDNDLTEMDLEGEGEKVKLRRGTAGPEVQYVQPAPAAAQQGPAPAPPEAGPGVESPPSGPPAEAAQPQGKTINSPMVGTFYASPSPDADAFVAVGDKVGPETVVCLIEAMKVFNEIKAEQSGTIEKILVENGQAVEYGQPLFELKPE